MQWRVIVMGEEEEASLRGWSAWKASCSVPATSEKRVDLFVLFWTQTMDSLHCIGWFQPASQPKVCAHPIQNPHQNIWILLKTHSPIILGCAIHPAWSICLFVIDSNGVPRTKLLVDSLLLINNSHGRTDFRPRNRVKDLLLWMWIICAFWMKTLSALNRSICQSSNIKPNELLPLWQLKPFNHNEEDEEDYSDSFWLVSIWTVRGLFKHTSISVWLNSAMMTQAS